MFIWNANKTVDRDVGRDRDTLQVDHSPLGQGQFLWQQLSLSYWLAPNNSFLNRMQQQTTQHVRFNRRAFLTNQITTLGTMYNFFLVSGWNGTTCMISLVDIIFVAAFTWCYFFRNHRLRLRDGGEKSQDNEWCKSILMWVEMMGDLDSPKNVGICELWRFLLSISTARKVMQIYVLFS